MAYPYFEEYRKQPSVFSSSAAFLGPTAFTVGAEDFRALSASEVRWPLWSQLDYFSTLRSHAGGGTVLERAN